MTTHTRVLIVANRTAATGALVSAVQRWAESEPAKFHLLVPAVPHGLIAWSIRRCTEPPRREPGWRRRFPA